MNIIRQSVIGTNVRYVAWCTRGGVRRKRSKANLPKYDVNHNAQWDFRDVVSRVGADVGHRTRWRFLKPLSLAMEGWVLSVHAYQVYHTINRPSYYSMTYLSSKLQPEEGVGATDLHAQLLIARGITNEPRVGKVRRCLNTNWRGLTSPPLRITPADTGGC